MPSKPRISYETALEKYKMWSDAEDARSTGASYMIAGRSLQMVPLAEIQMMLRKYGKIIDWYENGGRTRSRTSIIYPVDR